jgi:ribonuclease BN (tRNA processing enzyme)
MRRRRRPARWPRRARVRRMVCAHLLPGAAAEEVRAEAAAHFDGETIVGRDLMELEV